MLHNNREHTAIFLGSQIAWWPCDWCTVPDDSNQRRRWRKEGVFGLCSFGVPHEMWISALQVLRDATAIIIYCSSYFEVHKIAFLSKITTTICLYALSCVEFSRIDFIALPGLDSPMKAQMLLLVESRLSYWRLLHATIHLIVYNGEVFICPHTVILGSRYSSWSDKY